jgi:murein DD-endopeptidase MepM/ murein hydrolase activator NlpD
MTHLLQRTALIALASGVLGACSTTDELTPNFPTRMPETPPPAPAAAPAPAPTPSEPPMTAAPAAPVESHPLEPLPPARPPAARSAPAATPAATAPAPTYRSVTNRSVTGRVVEVEGRAVTYKVRKGDTLEEIADKLDTTASQLREDNGLKKHAKIHPGQVLQGPRTRGHAYVVGPGDTLYSIAKRFGVAADALREENELSRNGGLHAGEKLRLPDGYHDRGPLTTTTRILVASGAPTPLPADDPPEAEEPAQPAPRAEPPRTALQPAAPAMVPTYRSVTTRTVTGKVVDVEGPAVTYKVKKGDSLEKVARKLDTTVEQLREDNDLRRHEAIHPGQELQGPRTTTQAYVVGAGDTFYSIAKRFAVAPDELREENGLSRSASLHAGQRLRLPEGYRDRGPLTTTTRVLINPPTVEPPPPREAAAPAPAPVAQPIAPAPQTPPPAATPPPRPATPAPYSPPARPYAPPPAPPAPPRSYTPAPLPPRSYTPPPAVPPAAPTPADAQISELGRGRFVWPLQGPIVSDFGPKAPGQRNDGVNIGAPVGSSVRAAAGGDVVYAGDQVPGFGNLVLIKHADGWVTAYGHLSRVLVKMQQKVVQGQEIGFAGATGGVSEPQLHFEIRYAPSPLERARPIDPKLVLPK